ncbi:MAG: SPOR domain-containing protein [Sphingomonadales bacterium]
MTNDRENSRDTGGLEPGRAGPPASGFGFGKLQLDAITRQPLLMVVALITVAVFAGGIWYAYRTGANNHEPPPVIRAQSTPIKIQPDEPGGMDVPDQDKLVYDQLAGAEVSEAEELLPAAEEPTLPGDDAASPAAYDEDEPPAAPPPLPEEPTARSEAVALLGDNNYLVQLGAFRSQEAAERGWDRLSRRYPAVLGGFSSDIMIADLGARGIYYRLRAGPLATREDAEALCRDIKDRGQGCLVVAP